MKKYKLITIFLNSSNRVEIHSTDSQTISWLITEVKELIPTCVAIYSRKLPSSNDLCLCALEQLQNQDGAVPWFMMKKLCEHGWEPFAHYGSDGYSFRYEESQ